ncbi:hypothetical protein IB238_11685 [Rhizobium sp. ARZ01]|uniref:hypothetical protein n=1 Tax=Rhizobium sp. ARZ01 TaxID=2769313 RepID=UPI00177B6137|nr:hypothetical protein [Rhizobium sp. ARZ01]MBD9373280.1 hypothetical protein [Rhizobium sp. ARZ01]
MHQLKPWLALAGLLLALAGCNSTDALIPQVDVGSGTQTSSPVTQRDLNQVSAYSQPVGSAQANSMAGRSASSGTLEAQADALARNQTNPTASGEGGLVVGEQENTAPTSAKPTQTAALTPATDGDSIRFLPIIGAPVEAVTPLSKTLGAQARASGLTIKSSSDNTSRYILKGYFSAMQDRGKTTVVYVWDVLDSSGGRLHRIQGQDSVDATASDPWRAVPASTMEAIAQRTIQEYVSWREQTGG